VLLIHVAKAYGNLDAGTSDKQTGDAEDHIASTSSDSNQQGALDTQPDQAKKSEQRPSPASQGQADQQSAGTGLEAKHQVSDSTQPAVDDWGDFVS